MRPVIHPAPFPRTLPGYHRCLPSQSALSPAVTTGDNAGDTFRTLWSAPHAQVHEPAGIPEDHPDAQPGVARHPGLGSGVCRVPPMMTEDERAKVTDLRLRLALLRAELTRLAGACQA